VNGLYAAELPPLPVDDPKYRRDLEFLAQRANGFVYHGDRLNAVVDTVKVLRADPELARTLLEGSSQ
jgi:hypothetical protein